LYSTIWYRRKAGAIRRKVQPCCLLAEADNKERIIRELIEAEERDKQKKEEAKRLQEEKDQAKRDRRKQKAQRAKVGLCSIYTSLNNTISPPRWGCCVNQILQW